MPKGKSGKGRRRYSEELKAEAVQMLVDGHAAESVAERLGLSGPSLLYRWKARLVEAGGPGMNGPSRHWVGVRHSVPNPVSASDHVCGTDSTPPSIPDKKALAIFSQRT